PDAILMRALRAGLPVLLCVIVIWDQILGSVQTPAQRNSMFGVDLVLGIFFVLSASALIGAILARRNPATVLKRGTVLLDENETAAAAADPRALTLAGHVIPLLDETKHFKIIGTTGSGKSTAICELLAKALARGDRAVIADPDGGYAR